MSDRETTDNANGQLLGQLIQELGIVRERAARAETMTGVLRAQIAALQAERRTLLRRLGEDATGISPHETVDVASAAPLQVVPPEPSPSETRAEVVSAETSEIEPPPAAPPKEPAEHTPRGGADTSELEVQGLWDESPKAVAPIEEVEAIAPEEPETEDGSVAASAEVPESADEEEQDPARRRWRRK